MSNVELLAVAAIATIVAVALAPVLGKIGLPSPVVM